MHIALLGAAFDPPHLGHKTIPEEMLRSGIGDEVWYVPVKKHPFGKVVISDEHRVAMLKLLLADQSENTKEIRIEEYELRQDKPSYSLDTLEYFTTNYPEHTFSWVIGSDNLQFFHKWYKYEELLKKFRVYVYPRKGYPVESLHPGMILLQNVTEVEVSSTQIREEVKQGHSIKGLTIPSIVEYIQKHHLYL